MNKPFLFGQSVRSDNISVAYKTNTYVRGSKANVTYAEIKQFGVCNRELVDKK